MDFSEVARSAKRGVRASCEELAAEVVGHANPSTLIDNTSGRVAKAARELAAEVVALIRCLSSRNDCRPQTSSVQDRGQEQSRIFDKGLSEVRAQLARDGVPSQLFQAQLLLAIRHKKSVLLDADGEEAVDDKIPSTESKLGTDGGAGSSSVDLPRASGGARSECHPPSLTMYWWLHKSGLLPLSRLLEANETLPPPSAIPHRSVREGRRDSFAEPVDDWVDVIVQDFRALAGQSAREAGDPDSGKGYTAADADLVSDVAKHLFDLGYREVPGFEDVDSGGNAGDALSRRAARRVLDRLCCGPELFGDNTGSRSVGAEARMRGCLAVLDALDPTAAPADCLEANPAADSKRSANDLSGTTSTTVTGEEDVLDAAGATLAVGNDAPTTAFLARQLRLLLECSSGHSSEHTQNEYASRFEADTASSGGAICLLVGILHHFPPAQFIEVLRSICRGAVAGAADTTGWHIYKPLLRWETLGPVVRAAATAHAKEVPPAIALIGTELAAAAVNLVPPGEADGKGMARRNQHQGVLVLLAAFRLVAQADVCSRGARRRSGEGGLYARWVRSCFGVESPRGDGNALLEVNRGELREDRPGHGQEKEASEPACEDAPYLHGSEAVREAMEKQRASGILMEALCSSVPYDPAFVLEVHKDVLIMRLRAKFSVQVRDFVDLVATRLSDLKDQEEALRRKSAGAGFGRSVGVGVPMSRATGLAGDNGDATTREVGFFLRQFKQNGEVPLALKTAILWQPKSWAKIRKILLAPPGERIAMPDDSGNALPEPEGVEKETIGRGENGLRVEVSLKYRRLLVQQLAKESLLSAKDHDVFRKSYIEYLQGQRERDTAQRESPEKSKAMTAVARQLVLLESKLEQRKHVGNRQDREGSEAIGQTEGDGGVVPQRLALLLQEYLPRALVVELCMEDDIEAPYHMRPSSTGEGIPREERSLDSSRDRDWFSRAAHLFTQVLQEWEHCFRTEVSLPGIRARPPAQAGASPEEVAEAILNSTHCCVAAIGVSLGQDLLLSVLAPVQPCPEVSIPSDIPELLERGPGGGGGRQNQGLSPEAGSGTNEKTAFLGLPVARALRRVGEVISIAAGVEPLGEALCRRCSSLLTNPSRLDPKQLLSLAHVLAGLPSAFRPKVERLFADLIAEALPHKSAGGGRNARRSRSSTENMVGHAGTAQVGVLYLQSTLLLHGHISTSVAEKILDTSLEGSPTGPSGEDGRTCRRQSKGGRQSFVLAGSDDKCGDPPSPLGKGSVGFAPVVLLEYLWWVERRLSFARSTALEQGCGSHLAPGLVVLSRLLESVLKHPLIERALKQTFGAPGATMPPFERLIALEVAASNGEDFCSASAKLTFLESVTLSRLVPGPGDDTEGLQRGNVGTGEAKRVRRRLLSAQQRKNDTNSIVARVKDVWTECVACLFGEPGLRAAAGRRVGRNATPTAFEEGPSVESREECLGWGLDARASWRSPGADSVPGSSSGGGDGDGVQVLLDSILQVMGKLCSLEAAAVSVGRRSGPALHLKEMDDAVVAEKHSSGRGASLLLTETLALLKRRDATREGAMSPGLVLIAEIAIPAIGATEGRGKAIASLRLIWEEWLSKVRPLEYGTVVSLTRLALIWCGDDYDTRPSGGGDNGCPVVQMLEDLPLLAGEMASVWPWLARTLQPVIGPPHVPVGPYARGGWAFHLSNLHFVGGKLFQSLTSSGFESSKSDREAPTREATTESTTHPAISSKGDWGQTSSRKDGRIPLGPVNRCPQGQSEGQPRGQAGGKDTPTKIWQRAEDVIDVDVTPHAKVLPVRGGAVEPSHRDRSRGASTYLPRTCAELIIGVINASAAALDAMPIAKRPRDLPVPMGDAKRAKTHSLGLGASLGRAAASKSKGRGDGELLEGFDVHGTSSVVASQSSAIELRSPPPALWAARVIEPLYGPRKGNDGVSPLGVLLETLINELGESRRCGTGKGGERRIRGGGVFRSLAVSLVVAILRYAPPLVAHLAEPPCLVPSCASPTGPAERLGRSLAVLNSMGLLFGADVPPRHPNGCLTVILTHYTAALLSMSSIRNHSKDEQAARALPNGREWAAIVAFVHARVKDAAAEDLRLMPSAKAAQEVDPLLAQYLC